LSDILTFVLDRVSMPKETTFKLFSAQAGRGKARIRRLDSWFQDSEPR
jgi:hypothetical protein